MIYILITKFENGQQLCKKFDYLLIFIKKMILAQYEKTI